MVGEPIAAIIKRHIYEGQMLCTPGHGMAATGRRQFHIDRIDDLRILFRVPSVISSRFSEIESAVVETRQAGGRVRLGGFNGLADPGTLERFLQEARGNDTRTVTYVAPVLVQCGIAEYTMEGRAKGIRLVGCYGG